MSIQAEIDRPATRRAAPRSLNAEATTVFAMLAVAVLFGSTTLVASFDLPWTLIAASLVSFSLAAVFALPTLHHHVHARYGLANAITALRAAMTALVAGAVMTVDFADAGDATAWTLAAIAVSALVLDGIDGALARRAGLVSRYGARFDMEVDAFLILCLSAMAFMMAKAGAWVLLIGLMRYLFVAAALAQPRLATPLPESLRRKAICVVQVVALCLVVLPPVAPAIAAPLAAVALLLLVFSFGIDTHRLMRPEPLRA